MQKFTIYTVESAPERSKPALQGLQHRFGFIPNAAAMMAGSSALIGAFVGGFVNFHGSNFDNAEKQVLLLTNAVTLKCPWTVAFHSTMALEEGVAARDVQALRAGKLPSDPKYAALSGMAKSLIEKKGLGIEAEAEKFAAAGYSQSQILDVINGIGISTMAATTANLANTPVEDVFRANVWAAA
jgi:alkylhydroperoxidase family enzyme